MAIPQKKLIAHKFQCRNKKSAKVSFINDDFSVSIIEDTELCDGIGGVIWEGSIILSEFIREFLGDGSLTEGLAGFELGAGTGLTGIVSSMCGIPTLITDRHSDLAEKNVKLFLESAFPHITAAAVKVCDYSWGSDVKDVLKQLPTVQSDHKILYGAEIACLMKQHDLLINSIEQIFDSSVSALLFVTFDGFPTEEPKYKSTFKHKMKNAGFASAIVYVGSIEWDMASCSIYPSPLHNSTLPPLPPGPTNDNDGIFYNGYFRDLTCEFPNDLDWIRFGKTSTAGDYQRTSKFCSIDDIVLRENQSVHHVVAFFKISHLRVCARCNCYYFPQIHDRSCRFHTGLYVCRQHPAELKSSIDGFGDNLGYYGTGEEWDAQFWDCCGEVDKTHPGCCRDYHQMYL